MASISSEQWEKAKAMFEGGATLSTIEHKTKINGSTVSKKAKKLSWEKGLNSSKINNEINLLNEKSTLNQHQLDFHELEVERLSQDAKMIQQLTKGNLAGIGKHIKGGDMDIAEHKSAQDAIDKASMTLGVNQRFAQSQTTINNTNAQQNTTPTVIQRTIVNSK